MISLLLTTQGCSQSSTTRWARFNIFSIVPHFPIVFNFLLNFFSFSSSFLSSGWATCPPGKALATPLLQLLIFTTCFILCFIQPTVADDLRQAAAHLRQIQQDTVQNMEDTMVRRVEDQKGSAIWVTMGKLSPTPRFLSS